MMQICYSSDHKHIETDFMNANEENQKYNTQKKEEHKWANAESFVSSFSQDMILDSNRYHFNMGNQLLKEEISQNWTSKDLFTVNKIVENEEEQRLKEYLISNFNAFIDHASSLDYLEIEIPGEVLNYLSINIGDATEPCCIFSEPKCQKLSGKTNSGPYLKIVSPNDSLDPFHLYISGYNEDGSYASFSGNEFQFNDNENCELIKNFVSEKKWQKIFKLNGKHQFKFKFYFQQYGQNHQVVFGGQTFSFEFFEFSLRNPSSKRTLSCTIAEFGYYQIKEKARWCPYTPTPKSFVKTLEGMNMKFKFIFYLSNDFYNIYSPLESFQSNYYEQESFFKKIFLTMKILLLKSQKIPILKFLKNSYTRFFATNIRLAHFLSLSV